MPLGEPGCDHHAHLTGDSIVKAIGGALLNVNFDHEGASLIVGINLPRIIGLQWSVASGQWSVPTSHH